jgi:hypothetical protein
MTVTYEETYDIFPDGKYLHSESGEIVDVVMWDGDLESEQKISEFIGQDVEYGTSPDTLSIPVSVGFKQETDIGDYVIKFSDGRIWVTPNRFFESLFKPIEKLQAGTGIGVPQPTPKDWLDKAQNLVSSLPSELKGNISDGYHTFDELYSHRIALYIALCRQLNFNSGHTVWRSEKHSDGSKFEGWFVLGIGENRGEQITYHLPLSRWDECDFAHTLEYAYTFDGHTSADVLERLKYL